MNKFIFLLESPPRPRSYDVYESAVVISSSEDEARKIHPSGYLKVFDREWVAPENVIVTKIGVVTADVEDYFEFGEVISASYIGG